MQSIDKFLNIRFRIAKQRPVQSVKIIFAEVVRAGFSDQLKELYPPLFGGKTVVPILKSILTNNESQNPACHHMRRK